MNSAISLEVGVHNKLDNKVGGKPHRNLSPFSDLGHEAAKFIIVYIACAKT